MVTYERYGFAFDRCATLASHLGIDWQEECYDGDEWNGRSSASKADSLRRLEQIAIRFIKQLDDRNSKAFEESADIPSGSLDAAW